MTRKYSVSHALEGYSLQVYDVPWLRDQIEERLTGPLLSLTARMPEGLAHLLGEIPIGRPKHDKDGWLENSVYGLLWDIGQLPGRFAWKRTDRVVSIPLTLAQATALAPEFVQDCESIFDTANEVHDESDLRVIAQQHLRRAENLQERVVTQTAKMILVAQKELEAVTSA